MEQNFKGLFTIGLFLALLSGGQTHLNIFLNLHEVLRLIGECLAPFGYMNSFMNLMNAKLIVYLISIRCKLCCFNYFEIKSYLNCGKKRIFDSDASCDWVLNEFELKLNFIHLIFILFVINLFSSLFNYILVLQSE